MLKPRLATVVALAWVAVALGLTLFLAPQMGMRGWMWLSVHHWLCAVGAGWELREDYRRGRAARAAATADAHSAHSRADS